MSQYDNGYKAAQRAYDAQLPPDAEVEVCNHCKGEGVDSEGEVCRYCEGKGYRFFTAQQQAPIKKIMEDEAREEEGGPNDF